jgi:hypothetical protein
VSHNVTVIYGSHPLLVYLITMTTSPKIQISKYISDFELQHESDLEELVAYSTRLQDVSRIVEQTWSGSYIGWHGKMYFRDFEKPQHYERFSGEWGDIRGMPAGWEEKDADQVRAKLDDLIGGGFSVATFEDRVSAVRAGLADLRAEVDLMLSAISIPSSGKSREYLKELDALALGNVKGDFARARMPTQRMSRDTEALAQGTCLPSWLYFEGLAVEAGKTVEWLEQYKKIIRRLFQALEIVSPDATSQTSLTQFALHPAILAKCSSLYEAKAYAPLCQYE